MAENKQKFEKPAGGPGSMRGGFGKPKDLKATALRTFSYLTKRPLMLVAALISVILSSLSGVAGTYAMRPIINGLTDFAHPCQVLADLMTIREKMTRLEGLKLCFIGDGNNMANSLIVGGLKCGMDVSVACPAGYDPDPRVLDFAKTVTGAGFALCRDPKQAAKDADVIITDVWASMGQEGEKAKREAAFGGVYQVNEALMAVAHPGAMVQHCLPAHRGEEITAEVFEAHAGEIFDEAENRLHAQKAVMFLLMGEKN